MNDSKPIPDFLKKYERYSKPAGDIIVFDLETQHTFDEVGGRNFGALKISVLGYYSYLQDKYECLEEHELGVFENLLIDASLVIGYNSNKFDLPVLQPYLSLDVKTLPSLDLLEVITKNLGFRVGLDSVAKATLGIGKTGHGLDAIDYYREGKIEKLKSYCLNDVKVTKEVYDFGKENQKIMFMSRDETTTKTVTIDWTGPQSSVEALGEVSGEEQAQQYRLI